MKIYKIKDTMAIIWFFILIILQLRGHYRVVTVLLTIGMILDLIISVTDFGDHDLDLSSVFRSNSEKII